MDIQKKPTLAEKQAFWAEQLPKFESKYWLPSHFEFLVFDMNQGNYVIKDGLDPTFDDDATEIWHRVNTGWAMWKKAINFTQAQAVPDQLDVNSILHDIDCYFDSGLSNTERTANNLIQSIYEKLSGEIKAQEPAND